jgi:uncharacterized protein with HEPN domain
MKDDIVYLVHILECIRRIEEDIAEGQERFLASHMVQDAVLRNLQTLGESAKRISEKRKESHLEVEWPRIVAFRNVLVHEYLGINLERVWQIAQRDVPPLKQAVVAMLGNIGSEGSA